MKEKLQAIVNKLILLKIFILSVLKLYPHGHYWRYYTFEYTDKFIKANISKYSISQNVMCREQKNKN